MEAIIKRIARRLYRPGYNMDDIIQDGWIGYLSANINPDKNPRSYLAIRIKGEMVDGLRRAGTLTKAAYRREKLVGRYNFEALKDACYLNEDYILTRNIENALEELNSFDKRFIFDHYFKGKTITEIGGTAGQSKLCHRRKRILKRIRESL